MGNLKWWVILLYQKEVREGNGRRGEGVGGKVQGQRRGGRGEMER
jgi:hypothetical protein